MKLRKGDNVRVITGKNKGKEGTVILVLPRENKVLIEGVNVVKRHTKARGPKQTAEIVEKPMPVDASNVMLVHKGKPTRVGFKTAKDGSKVRVAKSTGEEI